jgi:hypothetical protein
LAGADEVHGSKIKAFILDMIKNVDLEPLTFQKLLLLINEMKTKEAQQEMVSELLPLLPNDLVREQYQQFLAVLEEPLFTLHNSPHIPKTEVIMPDESTREIDFSFNPVKLGISELLERSYSLRLTVQDRRGKRQVLDEVVLPWRSFNAPVVVDGQANMELFINDVLFMSWKE